MQYAKWAVVAALAALAVGAPSATAATNSAPAGSSSIWFSSQAAAHNSSTGVPSFVLTPGTSTTFDIAGEDVITASSPRRSFSDIYPSWTFVYKRYSLGVNIWTWTHYISWQANGQCITNRLANTGYDNYETPGWVYEGYGAYVINQINPQCYPLGTWWAGRQGHFYSWVWHQDDYPWQLFEAYATGNARTYDWGCNCA